MNKNVKIAKQLIKLAKNIVAEQNIADHSGEYKNFTGTIDWKGTKGTVKNATFTLIDRYPIAWDDGTWEDGIFDGMWLNGTWEDGIFDGGYYSFWKNGTWKNGTWKFGQWENGTWNDGKWYDGKWIYGLDKNGNKHGKNDSPDNWNK